MSEKAVINTVYHAAVVSGLSVGYTMIAKKFLKMKSADMGKMDFEDIAKIVALVSASMFTKDYLVKQGIIPRDIDK